MTRYRRGPLPRQFDYAEYVAEAKAQLERVRQQEDFARAQREAEDRKRVAIAGLLQKVASPASLLQAAATRFRPSMADRPTYWEWDMTTPNTMLCRTGKRGWLS
jgi:hypothetical protein